jgi:hypothetical protein
VHSKRRRLNSIPVRVVQALAEPIASSPPADLVSRQAVPRGHARLGAQHSAQEMPNLEDRTAPFDSSVLPIRVERGLRD